MVGRKRKSRKKKKPSAAPIILTVLAVVLLTAGIGAWAVLAPYGPAQETFVEVPNGSSTARIGLLLEEAGVVRTQYAFELVRFWKRGTLRAGEYRFDHAATVSEIYTRITHGDVFTRSVTIPEGSTIFDIATRLEQAGLGPRKDFLDAAARQTSLITDLDPDAATLEGYLFPDTYHLPRKASPEQICATMVRRFRAVAAQLGLDRHVHEVVTLASIVERETAVDGERPMVASVFQNRLGKNMPLMTDPAVIYGLQREGRWRGTIYKSDLAYDTAYNTYLHKGLPPGPIANPGIKSLRAAMDPAHTAYLYFVAAGANPQGHSVFSADLKQQNQNVAGYRHAITSERHPIKRAGGR